MLLKQSRTIGAASDYSEKQVLGSGVLVAFWLASGDVDIEGTIDLSGQDGNPASPILDQRRRADAGAGGFAAGVGGKATSLGHQQCKPPNRVTGREGAVPAAGCTATALGGTFTGNVFLVPLVGGSGGGASNYFGNLGSTPYGAGGSGGGCTIFIASSTTITVTGTINTNGGVGGNASAACGNGSGGSGGGIRLAANKIEDSGAFVAAGGNGQVRGGDGVVRIEAFTDNFAGGALGTRAMASPFGTFLPTTPPGSVSVISVDTVTLPQPPYRQFGHA